MLTAGAPYGDGELLFAFRHVPGHDAIEQRAPALLEFLGFRPAQNVIAHGLIKAGERAQLGVIVRIGKEAHVHDQVGIHGSAMLEAERVHRNLQALAFLAGSEQRTDGAAQLSGHHIGCVDDMMRLFAHVVEHLALTLDAVCDGAAIGAERMAASAGFIPRDELLIVGVQEQHPIIDAGAFELRKLFHQAFEEAAAARIAHHGDTSMIVRLAGHAG